MSYSYTTFRDDIANSERFPDITNNLSIRTVINRSVRNVNREVDLKSTKRKAGLTSRIFDNVYDYPCPADLKALIDFQPQLNRDSDTRIKWTTEELFDRKKEILTNLVTISHDDMARKIRASMDVKDTTLKVSNMDSLTEDGTWTLFGDAENVALDNDNYAEGSGSIKFDISSAGGTTAGIYKVFDDQFDITDYVSGGSAIVWHYASNVTNLTNFILRIGNDASNYYDMTATTQVDGNAFVVGWNLLKFDFSGKSETGSVTDTTCDYVAIYMTKDGAKVSETDYRFDDFQLHVGQIFSALFYSNYCWQTSGGTWIENSTADTDILNATSEEYDLFVENGKREVFNELKEWDLADRAEKRYQEIRKAYTQRYPSERLKLEQRYY